MYVCVLGFLGRLLLSLQQQKIQSEASQRRSQISSRLRKIAAARIAQEQKDAAPAPAPAPAPAATTHAPAPAPDGSPPPASTTTTAGGTFEPTPNTVRTINYVRRINSIPLAVRVPAAAKLLTDPRVGHPRMLMFLTTECERNVRLQLSVRSHTRTLSALGW